MLSQLQALGLKNTIHLVADFSGDAVVLTATVIPKEKSEASGRRTIQLSGPVAEVDANLPAALLGASASILAFQHNLAAIEAENAKLLAEASKKGGSRKGKPTAKPESEKEDKSDGEEAEEEAPPAPAPAPIDPNMNMIDRLIAEANAKK